MNIGATITKLRKNKGLSQKELAKMCGLSTTSMNQIENGRFNPTYTTLTDIASALHTDAALIYFMSCEPGKEMPEGKKELFEYVRSFVVIMFESFYL